MFLECVFSNYSILFSGQEPCRRSPLGHVGMPVLFKKLSEVHLPPNHSMSSEGLEVLLHGFAEL